MRSGATSGSDGASPPGARCFGDGGDQVGLHDLNQGNGVFSRQRSIGERLAGSPAQASKRWPGSGGGLSPQKRPGYSFCDVGSVREGGSRGWAGQRGAQPRVTGGGSPEGSQPFGAGPGAALAPGRGGGAPGSSTAAECRCRASRVCGWCSPGLRLQEGGLYAHLAGGGVGEYKPGAPTEGEAGGFEGVATGGDVVHKVGLAER